MMECRLRDTVVYSTEQATYRCAGAVGSRKGTGIMSIVNDHGPCVVEDAAHGVEAKYDGRCPGTIGHVTGYSFHITKHFTSGEGGAFLTSDETLARPAEVIREKRSHRWQFPRGEVHK
jgi:dTDP-4-amino-4,6-dideoxygalactose transaminase